MAMLSELARCSAGLAAVALVCGAASADTPPDVDRLLALEFGRLLDVQVSLATRTERRVFDTASAAYVLGRDEILRSGYTRLVDVLRLLPGVHVGRGNANQYGVSIRNGMNRFASTALVMIDGRHVYTPLFGGVRWETQELPLDSIDRIELVRGPGGPLWGANAVDGIIHVITRPADGAEGGRLAASAGRGELRHDLAAAWSGAVAGAAQWRLDARALRVDDGEYLPAAQSTHRGALVPGTAAGDGGDGWVLRARLDGDAGTWTAHAGLSGFRFGETRALLAGPRANSIDHAQGFATLDWRHRLDRDDTLRLRLTADQARIADDVLDESQTLVDADLQADLVRGAHLLTLGGGWRHYRSRALLPAGLPCTACFGLDPQVRVIRTVNAFVQDQWSPGSGWMVTGGVKVEANGEGERNWQPTLRVNWEPARHSSLWAALTRPVRTPTRAERDTAFFAVPPALIGLFGCREVSGDTCRVGDPQAPSWRIDVAELGWRQRLGERADLDATLFRSDYDYRLTGADPTTATGQRLEGLELVARWRASRAWQLQWHSSWHRGRQQLANGSEQPVPLLPRQSHLLRAGAEHGPWRLDLLWSWVGDVERPASAGLPVIRLPNRSQGRVRLAWRAAGGGEWSFVAGGLGADARGEYVEATKVNTAPRAIWAVAWSHGFR